MEKFLETYNVNMVGVKALTEAMLPYMKDGGRVIIVSSRGGSLSWNNERERKIV